MKAPFLPFFLFLSIALSSSARAQRSAIMRNDDAVTQRYISEGAAMLQRSLEASKVNLATNTGWQVLPPRSFQMVVRQVSQQGVICELACPDFELGGFHHDRYLLLVNYPAAPALLAGTPLTDVSARRIGRMDIFGETSGIYECASARPKEPDPLGSLRAKILADQRRTAASNRLAAANLATFNFHYQRATNGIASSQRRLAELYAAGIGCEKDTNAAAAWLAAAATNTPAK